MIQNKLEARLEIRLAPEQLKNLKEEAASRNASVGSLVREAIDLRYEVTENQKLNAVKKLAELDAPVSNWDKMKSEIEKGVHR